jgi:hypothetical protein
LPSDVPLAGCPTAVEPEACTRCTKSQTHLRLSYAEAPTEMRGAWAHALGADDWKVSIRRARVDGGIATIVARKGHDRLTLVIMDAARFGGDGTAISLTFTPG